MASRPLFIVLCILCGVCLSVLPSAQAEEQAQPQRHWYVELAETDVPVHADWAPRVLAFNKRTMLAAYQEHGQRDEAWDEDVAILLTDWEARFSNYPVTVPYAQLQATANRLLARKELKDPLVLYFLAKTMELERRKRKKAWRLYVQAGPAWLDSAYPTSRKYFGILRHYQGLRNLKKAKSEKDSPVVAAAVALMPEMMTGPDYDDDEQGSMKRQLVGQMCDKFLTGKAGELHYSHALLEAAAPHLETWWGNAISGWAHVQIAWAHRGGGYANTVTEEGWRLMAEHLSRAEACFTKGWQIDSSEPFCAGNMVTVAMGHDTQLSEAIWFRRAVEAEFDNSRALNAMSWSLRPRWGGSHSAMLAMGRICAATERYDTLVPAELTDQILHVYNESKESEARVKALFSDQELWAQVDKLTTGYAEADPSYWTPEWARSIRVGLAWRFGHQDLALQEMQSLGDKLNPRALRLWGLSVDDLVKAQKPEAAADF